MTDSSTPGLGERRRRREAERAAAAAATPPLTRRELRAREEALASGALILDEHGVIRPSPHFIPPRTEEHAAGTPEVENPPQARAAEQERSESQPGPAQRTSVAAPTVETQPEPSVTPSADDRADSNEKPLTRRQLRELRAAQSAAPDDVQEPASQPAQPDPIDESQAESTQAHIPVWEDTPAAPPKRISVHEPLGESASLPDATQHTARRPAVRPADTSITVGEHPTGELKTSLDATPPVRRSVMPDTTRPEDLSEATADPTDWQSMVDIPIVTGVLPQEPAVVNDGAPLPTTASSRRQAVSAGREVDTTLDQVIAGDEPSDDFQGQPAWAAVGAMQETPEPPVRDDRELENRARSMPEAGADGDDDDDDEDEAPPRLLAVLQWVVIFVVIAVLGMLVWYLATYGLDGPQGGLPAMGGWRNLL